MATKRLLFSCVVFIALTGSETALWGQGGGFAYVANDTDNSVSGYSINKTTGALTPVPGSPFPAGFVPQSVTVDPTGRFAYVANSFGANVSAYTINGTTGALTAIIGSPFSAGTAPQSVTVDPTGRFAYVANRGSNNISAYAIDGTTGALTPVDGSSFPAGSVPYSVTVHSTGQFAYVANRSSNNVSAYTIDGATGALTAIVGSPFPAGVRPQSVAVDSTGQFAYVANCGSGCDSDTGFGNVSAYTINGTTGALTEVVGSPFAAGAVPHSLTVHPTGPFVYVANTGEVPQSLGTVSAYTINGITGALTPVAGSPFTVGKQSWSVTVDPAGQFLYVTNLGSRNVMACGIDQTTGALGCPPYPTDGSPASVTTTAGPPPPAF